MNSKTCLFGGTILAAGLVAPASAQLYVASDRSVTASSVLCDEWDWDLLPDFGVIGFDGPLGAAGSGPVPAGFLSGLTTFDSEYSGPGGGSRGAGGTGLVGVGPSAGFGNTSNSVKANFFVDAFGIDLGPDKCGFLFTPCTLLGGTDVEVWADGVLVGTVPADGTTYFLGGAFFSHVSIYDPIGGAEGIMGYGATYTVPAPGALALLGLGGLTVTRRRR